jgi:CRISPR-associated protein Csb2
LVSLSDGAEVFTGCDSSGKPLRGHGHAYVLCESNPVLGRGGRGGRGEITHVTVFARMGFGPREQEALQGLRDVWGPGEVRVSLLLQGMGRPEDFGGMDLKRGQSPLLAESRTWISRTPFITNLHPKETRAGEPKLDAMKLQKGSPEFDLRRWLSELVIVEPVAGTKLNGREVPWHAFLCRREVDKGKPAANGAGYGFRIKFQEPVRGPVSVGYASHFGMGIFVADTIPVNIEGIKADIGNRYSSMQEWC